MIKVYAVVLTAGVVALLAWIFLSVLASSSDRSRRDPEALGLTWRRVVAGAVGFGIAGLSAEYSARDLSWQIAGLIAVGGAALAAWYAGKVGVDDGSRG